MRARYGRPEWESPPERLCGIQHGSVHCDGQDGSLRLGVEGLYEDRKGNLWVGMGDGLWRWKPGRSDFYPMPGNPSSIRAFAEDDDGALLISTPASPRRQQTSTAGACRASHCEPQVVRCAV